MIKVITYGTYDLLHYGHIRLLERAKKLGDYLIVGVTADDFDKTRGKINVQQSLEERIGQPLLPGEGVEKLPCDTALTRDAVSKPTSECMYNRKAVDAWIKAQKQPLGDGAV